MSKIKAPQRVHTGLNECADLYSTASPNQQTDPKSVWARNRAIKNMSKQQLLEFSLAANKVLEFVWDKIG